MERKLKLREEVVFQKNEEDIMIYVADEGMIHIINGTGAYIIESINKGVSTPSEIEEEMMKDFKNVNQETLHSDIQEFIEKLKELQIIEG